MTCDAQVLLDDVIQYRVHILLDSARMEETLLAAQFHLDCELWFTEVSVVVSRPADLEPSGRRRDVPALERGGGEQQEPPALLDSRVG